MGTVIYLRRASPADISRVRSNPDTLDAFVFEQGEEGVDLVDFDKAWQALHFTLTGEAYGAGHPLGIIADETPIEATDENGLGGFSVIEPVRMRSFASALSAIDDATLAERVDPKAMLEADIYIADAFADGERDEEIEYIFQGLPALRRFAASCAERGDGALRIVS